MRPGYSLAHLPEQPGRNLLSAQYLLRRQKVVVVRPVRSPRLHRQEDMYGSCNLKSIDCAVVVVGALEAMTETLGAANDNSQLVEVQSLASK